MRTILILILIAALTVGAFPVASSDDAASPFELTDQAGDVHLQDASSPVVLPQNALSDLADLKALRVLGETGLDVQIQIQMGALTLPVAILTADVPVFVVTCFQLQGVQLGLVGGYYVDKSGGPPYASFARVFKGACSVENPVTLGGTDSRGGVEMAFNVQAATTDFLVPKSAILDLLGTDHMVAPGDKISAFQVLTEARVLAQGRLRDALPDQGVAAEEYVLTAYFSNQHLKVSLADDAGAGSAGAASLRCSGFSRRVIGVQAGGYLAVPLVLQNDRDSPSTVIIEAKSDDSAWIASVIRQVTLEPARKSADGNVTGGNRTVTLIMRSPEGAGKACTQIRVTVGDPDDPMRVGEMIFDAMATPLPSVESATLFLHTNPNLQTLSNERVWLNAAQEDANGDPAAEIRFVPPMQPQVGSSSKFTLEGRAEIAYPFDILLDRDGTVAGKFQLRSDPVPTKARLTLSLLSGGEEVAAGSVETTIPSTGASVSVPALVTPDLYKSATRRAPSDLPISFMLVYEPLPPDPLLPDELKGQGSGYVYLRPGGSSIELPIKELVLTHESKVGPKGGLVSMFIDEKERAKLVNDGRSVFFNFSVTNEGASLDSYQVATKVIVDNPVNWTVVFPNGIDLRDLSIGDRRTLSVLITAPTGAPESSTARLVVTVKGELDGASASSLATVQVAKGGDHGVVYGGEPERKGSSPSIEVGIVGLLLVFVAWVGRRSMNG